MQREARRADAFEHDVAGPHLRFGPLLPAVRAAVVAEVAEVDGVEDVGGAAAAAVLGIGRVRHPGQRQRIVIDAEVQRLRALASEVRDQRVVGVEHEPLALQLIGPALGDRLKLAVAVELVAEQVAEQDRARVQLGGDRVEPQLVDLEQAELAVDPRARPRRREQRGRDAARHVRALGVVYERDPGLLEHARRERRGRRLAVRRRYEHAAVAQARAK